MRSFVVVGSAFLLHAFTLGSIMSYGPFFIRFERDLNASAGQSSLANSLLYGAFFLVGPFSSILSNRFGFRKTIILGVTLSSCAAVVCAFSRAMYVVQATAVVIGGGCGLAIVAAFALLGTRFEEKRSLVYNVVTTGGSLLSIPLSPLVQFWIDVYSWRGAILLLGGMFFNALPSGLLLTSESNSKRAAKRDEKTDTNIPKSFSFAAYMIACGSEMAAMIVITVYLVRYAQSLGLDNYLAASLPSLVGIIDVSLSPFSGYVTSLSHVGRVTINRSHIFVGISLCQSLVVVMYTVSSSIYAIVAITTLYAVCIGARGALAITLTADLFGPEKLVNALGVRAFAIGVFSASAPPLVGKIVDDTGSYAAPFYFSAALSALSAGLVMLVNASTSREERTAMKTVEESNSKLELQILPSPIEEDIHHATEHR